MSSSLSDVDRERIASRAVVISSPVWGTGLAIGGAVLGVGYAIAQVAGIDDWIDGK